MSSARRREYLTALGLDAWTLRAPPGAPVERAAPAPEASAVETAAIEAPAVAAAVTAAATAQRGVPREAAAPEAARRTESRGAAALDDAADRTECRQAAALDIAPQAKAPREAAYDWPELRERVAGCTRCALSATRIQTVFGVGNLQADWMVVGEAPGAEEDQRGEPFVGRAGQLLNAMLHAIGLEREQVYIANVLKCRPPRNRDPLPGESAECLPFLERQVALLRPKVMLVVGRIAAQTLLRTGTKVGQLRQQVHYFGAQSIPLVVTYHPAYLLRSPAEKRKAWEDLKLAREVLGRG